MVDWLVVLIAAGLIIRLQVMESPVLPAMEEKGVRERSQLLAAIMGYPRMLVIVTLGPVVDPVAGSPVWARRYRSTPRRPGSATRSAVHFGPGRTP